MRHVVCFGNALHGDDGFGVRVFERLEGRRWPATVRLFLVGTAGLDALGCFEGCHEAILVDALAPGGSPGELRIAALAADGFALEGDSAHGNGVGYLLHAVAALLSPPPRLTLVGAEAASVQPFNPNLSAPVLAAVPRAVACIEVLLA